MQVDLLAEAVRDVELTLGVLLAKKRQVVQLAALRAEIAQFEAEKLEAEKQRDQAKEKYDREMARIQSKHEGSLSFFGANDARARELYAQKVDEVRQFVPLRRSFELNKETAEKAGVRLAELRVKERFLAMTSIPEPRCLDELRDVLREVLDVKAKKTR